MQKKIRGLYIKKTGSFSEVPQMKPYVPRLLVLPMVRAGLHGFSLL
jgi:hypothetical protein